MTSTLNMALAIFFLPLAGFVVLALRHRRIPRHGDWLATGVMGVALALALIVFGRAWTAGQDFFIHFTFEWLPVAGAKHLLGGVVIDGLTAVMLVVVTLVSFLVHLFSVKYMEDDVRYGRYFASLQLFSMSMLGLVLADNLLFLFIFWELVGLSSYVLIGHWFEKKSASNAAIKAFITTRIGDVGMLLGLLICYWKVGSLQLVDLFAAVANPDVFDRHVLASFMGLNFDWLTLAGLGLFFGAMGKSAQFPFHVWLPDAMEGPTPISALIHAATMVAAGVYLVGRLFPFFTPDVFIFVAYVGAFTALFAATIATVQDDIKKVLAYSTLSQLGYMMLALGVGGYVSGLFHLTTHAFFKAGLFLGSGAVIHAMHHEQSMSKYGGLWKKLPITGGTYLVCVLAISGFPPFAGFFSKDAILADSLAFYMQHAKHWFLPAAGFATAFLTAYYMFRQFFLTFTGRPRDEHAYDHAHESPWQMTVPLIVLAALALVGGWGHWFERVSPNYTREAVIEDYRAYHETHGMEISALLAGSLAAEPEHGAAHAEAAAHGEGAEAAGGEHATGEHDDHGAHSAHLIAMALSISLAALGLIAAAAAFYEMRGRTVIDPSAVAQRIRPIHTLLWNKYYIDELYGLTIIGGTMALMRVMNWFDKWVIDLIVNACGWLGKGTAVVMGILDNWIVDGAVNGAAALSTFAGDRLSLSVTGRIRNYLMFIALGVVCLTLIFMFAI